MVWFLRKDKPADREQQVEKLEQKCRMCPIRLDCRRHWRGQDVVAEWKMDCLFGDYVKPREHSADAVSREEVGAMDKLR